MTRVTRVNGAREHGVGYTLFLFVVVEFHGKFLP